jgi:hypothetical protein
MYEQPSVLPVEQRGSSSIVGTEHMRSQLPALFERYNINSMFDAGANDAAWQSVTLANIIEYSAGERNPVMVDIARSAYPLVDIKVHDVTADPLPSVDLLFVRDVAIHLNNHYKREMIQRWKESSIPWILMTQLSYVTENLDFEHSNTQFPFADINWLLPPWSWPTPTESITEMPNSTRHMSLWHRSQIWP